jgi:UDP-N-acetylglucosamine 2-epimerase
LQRLKKLWAANVLTWKLLHFAATEQAAANLRNEGVSPETIHATGNTGIDAILYVRDGLEQHRFEESRVDGTGPPRRK